MGAADYDDGRRADGPSPTDDDGAAASRGIPEAWRGAADNDNGRRTSSYDNASHSRGMNCPSACNTTDSGWAAALRGVPKTRRETVDGGDVPQMSRSSDDGNGDGDADESREVESERGQGLSYRPVSGSDMDGADDGDAARDDASGNR
jgi:hypothetical protein